MGMKRTCGGTATAPPQVGLVASLTAQRRPLSQLHALRRSYRISVIQDFRRHHDPVRIGLRGFALILTSFFILRPLAIWISLIGSGASPLTRLFFGWFGPRGLATALFALLVLDEFPHEFSEEVLNLAINTVWISALLHGVTAAPFAKWYGKRIADMGDCPEMQLDTSSNGVALSHTQRT